MGRLSEPVCILLSAVPGPGKEARRPHFPWRGAKNYFCCQACNHEPAPVRLHFLLFLVRFDSVSPSAFHISDAPHLTPLRFFLMCTRCGYSFSWGGHGGVLRLLPGSQPLKGSTTSMMRLVLQAEDPIGSFTYFQGSNPEVATYASQHPLHSSGVCSADGSLHSLYSAQTRSLPSLH